MWNELTFDCTVHVEVTLNVLAMLSVLDLTAFQILLRTDVPLLLTTVHTLVPQT